MLDGRSATTHWALCDEFARRFPLVDVNPNVLFVDNGRVPTSAGAAAGIDLCLHLVRRDHGAAAANATARRCVVAPWREGGQAQVIDRPLPDHGDASTSATRQWALRRLSEPLTLADLARHASMSVRTLTRRFREEVGQSPQQWVVQRRVDHARHLLESTGLSIGEVAREAGFTDPLLLRRHLRTSVGLTPNAYRRAYSAPSPPSPIPVTGDGPTRAAVPTARVVIGLGSGHPSVEGVESALPRQPTHGFGGDEDSTARRRENHPPAGDVKRPHGRPTRTR